MPKEVTIYGKAGQKYIVVAPTGEKVSTSQDKARTRGAVTITGTYVDPEPPPVDPPPPADGTIIPPGSNLASHIEASEDGDRLLLMTGQYLLTRQANTARAVRIEALDPSQAPVIGWPTGTLPNGIYFQGGPNVLKGVRIESNGYGTGSSMGSASAESEQGNDHLYEDCVFIGHPDLDDHQQLLYLNRSYRIIVRRCLFIANGTDGFGVHNYPAGVAGTPPSNVVVEDCTFRGFKGSAAITSEWPITVRRSIFEDCTTAIQLRGTAAGSILQDNKAVNVTVKVQNPGLAAVNTWI